MTLSVRLLHPLFDTRRITHAIMTVSVTIKPASHTLSSQLDELAWDGRKTFFFPKVGSLMIQPFLRSLLFGAASPLGYLALRVALDSDCVFKEAERPRWPIVVSDRDSR